MTPETPFAIHSPEHLSPERFKDIFVKEHTWVNALETPKDFIIDGSRGSGKSMLLNYLKFSNQLYYFGGDLKRLLEERKGSKYVGTMVHVTNEELNTSRYELLIRNNFAEKGFVEDLCMHDVIMVVLYKILKTLTEVKEMAEFINCLDRHQVMEFCKRQIQNLDRKNIYQLDLEQKDGNIDLLKVLADIFLKERDSIRYYGNEKFQMRETIYKGNYASLTYMNGFIKGVKELLGKRDLSFYVLIDNGDDARDTMQLCIDRLIAQRKHNDVCIKVAVKKGAHWNRGNIQWPHDYSKIDIDELYSTQHTVYYNRVKEIANIRLKLAGISGTIEDFLVESSSEKELLEDIKNELRVKYEKEYDMKYGKETTEEHPSKSEYVNNRVSKYAQAELFRRLKKTGKSYAGFDNIVHLSSGIIRQFLDICSFMFEEEMKRKGGDITHISLKTQNDVIKKYADDFMDELENTYKRLEEEDVSREEGKYYKDLYILIEALGEYYKERLMDRELKEPRVFTFTLKDPGKDPEMDKILELGVNENYFQSYWYSSKVGIGKYRGYAFNRRLCPRYGIDHTSFRGRIELATADLKRTIKTRKVPKSKVRTTLDLFGRGE